MKSTTSLPSARESAVTNRRRPLRQTLCWTLAGFGFGVVSAATYLLLGGDYLVFVPRWALIVFYPGFLAGLKANDWGLGEASCKVVGVLAVGLAYAALAALPRLLWFALKHHRQSAALRKDSE